MKTLGDVKTLFETVVGSKGYGLALPTSDTDVLRVVAHGPEHYLGLEPYVKAQHSKQGDEEVVTYDVRFFASLLLKGSFNAHLPLFFERKKHATVAPAFEDFLENALAFFTARSVRSFWGFASRSYKEFVEKKNFKTAANGLLVFEACVDLATDGALSLENLDFLLDVKRGHYSFEYVEGYFRKGLALFPLEKLVYEPFVGTEDSAQKLLSALCVEILTAGN